MARRLARLGISTSIVTGNGKRFWAAFLIHALTSDVVYFQKRYLERDLQVARLLRALGKKTVFDLDDGPAGSEKKTRRSQLAEDRGLRMMRTCTSVVVGSHTLLGLALQHNSRSYLVPTSVELDFYHVPERVRRGPITLGWIGSGQCYQEDLISLLAPLSQLTRRVPLRIVLIGVEGARAVRDAYGSLTRCEIKFVDGLDWACSSAAPVALQEFDIGLYPVLDAHHRRYKCGFKALEYMAAGVPVVASPVGENCHIIRHGVDGFLAESEADWEAHLTTLIQDANLRKTVALEARMKIEKFYSTEVCALQLKGILESLCRLRQDHH